MSYNSKYTGQQVEELLDQVANGNTGGGSSSGGSGAYSLVEHGTSDTTFTLTPNTFHVWDEVASLDLSFGTETSGVANEYLFQFTSGATATTLTLPDDIKWANDSAPTIAENMIYQISVLKGLASVLEFSSGSSSIFPVQLQVGDNGTIGQDLYNYVVGLSSGSSFNLTLEDGDVVIGTENCTAIVVNNLDLSYYNKITLLTESHNTEGSNCYYLYDTGVLELYED